MLNRHTFSVLVPTCFQDKPTSAGLHTSPKTMCFCAPAVVWLERPLWHQYAPRKTLNVAYRLQKNQRQSPIENPKWKCYVVAAPHQNESSFPHLWKFLWKSHP